MEGPRVLLAAFSDVHGPRYLHYLRASLPSLSSAGMILIAGDIVDKGAVHHCRLVMDVVRSVYKGPVVAVFGNEEYDEVEGELRESCADVRWLKDEVALVEASGARVAVVGTRGALDEPTRWQARNVPNIREIYERRLALIERLLAEAKRGADYVVLLTHYAPLCSTLEGEPTRIWSQMGSRKLTRIIMQAGPDAVIHGHAHNSVKLRTTLGRAEVYNVALPATKGVTLVELRPRGLESYLLRPS